MSSADAEPERAKGVKFGKEEGKEVEKTVGEEEDDEKNETEEEEDEEEEEEGDIEEEEEEEEGEEDEKIKVKKKRCHRRKKISQVCYDDDGVCEDDEEVPFFHQDEEEEVEEEGEDEDEEAESEVSYGASILSAITFEWENEIYEFDELCDPGNIENIYKRYYSEPDLVDDIGVLRYLHACNLLRITPMVRLLRAFETNEIDLSHRNLDGKNIKAMCYALETNIFVERLILRFNRLNVDDSFCIGRMLGYNEKISYLDFTGCRINSQGAEALAEHIAKSETLTYLNLSKCNLEDEGAAALSQCLMRNNSIQHLDLSYNNLGEGAAEGLGMALKMNSCITTLNLRYNNLFDVQALKGFFRGLTLNPSIINLNLAWNGMSGKEIGGLVGGFLKKSSSVVYLDLSDNRFEGPAVGEIKKGLARSKTLVTLKIGNNPMTPENLESLLSGTKNCPTLEVLDLENLWVKKTFLKALKKIQQEREIEVKIGGVFGNYEVYGPDYPKVILQRAQFEAMKPKKVKKRKDFGHLIWTLGEEPMTEEEFMKKVKKFKAKVNKELYPELIKEFFNAKLKLIDVVGMKEKYLSIFPDSEPPPPPKQKDRKKKKGSGKEGKKETKEELIATAGGEHAPGTQTITETDEEGEEEMIEIAEVQEEIEENSEMFVTNSEGEDEEEEGGAEEVLEEEAEDERETVENEEQQPQPETE